MKSKKNRRKYIRVSTVFPVEFYILDAAGERVTPWLQGFTRDIGKGGICLIANDLWWGFWDKFNYRGAQLFLHINAPFKNKPIALKAKVSWIKQHNLGDYKQYLAGLEFIDSDAAKHKSLFKYAVGKKATPFLVGSLVAVLLAISAGLFLRSSLLIRENKRLVSDYVDILAKRSYLEERIDQEEDIVTTLNKKQKELTSKILALEKETSQWHQRYLETHQEYTEEKGAVNDEAQLLENKVSLLGSRIKSLQKENQFLKAQAEKKKETTQEIKEEVRELDEKRFEFSQKVIGGMYDWIKNRQDLRRGLVLSYEGDRSLEKVCFTYDQALAVIVFTVNKDYKRAEKLLDFYLREVKKGKKIYNAYFTQGDVFEYVVHSGPNAWMGLAVLNYIHQTNDKKHLSIAKEVAEFLTSMMDTEGGIIGGPGLSWYSTEHNLDAYAFFRSLYQLTSDQTYLKRAKKIRRWISDHAYTDHVVPVKRGKGDATIATDTYTWSITAFGPKELYDLNMDPETILDFAVDNCKVKVNFNREDGKVNLVGFDFAKFKNSARGGVVSGEWTSQMILAFEIMADYYKDKDPEKSRKYLKQALYYFNELQKMLITSFSKVGRVDPCLPYASAPHVDTGHGWRTPKGNKTGSLASTAYFLLAYHGYNPLRIDKLDVSLQEVYKEKLEELAAQSSVLRPTLNSN